VISITVTLDEQHYFLPHLVIQEEGRSSVYNVFRQLESGEFLHVASRDELEDAMKLARELRALWPAEYVVRDSEGNDVDLAE
jgi:hypothetical protein